VCSISVLDGGGRAAGATNPTEINGLWNPAGDDAARGWKWTTQSFDWKDRPLVTTLPKLLDPSDPGYASESPVTSEVAYDGCGCAPDAEGLSRPARPRRVVRSPQVGRRRLHGDDDEVRRARPAAARAAVRRRGSVHRTRGRGHELPDDADDLRRARAAASHPVRTGQRPPGGRLDVRNARLGDPVPRGRARLLRSRHTRRHLRPRLPIRPRGASEGGVLGARGARARAAERAGQPTAAELRLPPS
jgi:hypothetical protein